LVVVERGREREGQLRREAESEKGTEPDVED
jgi:hypothetical protein